MSGCQALTLDTMPIVVYWHKQEDVKAKSGLASGFSALHHYTTFEMVSFFFFGYAKKTSLREEERL